jgi:hypothetical protein
MYTEFDLTMDDVEAYGTYYVHQSPQYRKILKTRRLVAYLISLVFLLVGIFLLIVGSIFSGIITVIAGIFLFIYYYIIFSPSNLQKRIRKVLMRAYGKSANNIIGKHKLTISPDGVTDVTDMDQTTTKWKMIEHVISTDKHIFLTATNGLNVHIIPKTAFSEDVSLKQFIKESETYQKKT